MNLEEIKVGDKLYATKKNQSRIVFSYTVEKVTPKFFVLDDGTQVLKKLTEGALLQSGFSGMFSSMYFAVTSTTPRNVLDAINRYEYNKNLHKVLRKLTNKEEVEIPTKALGEFVSKYPSRDIAGAILQFALNDKDCDLALLKQLSDGLSTDDAP